MGRIDPTGPQGSSNVTPVDNQPKPAAENKTSAKTAEQPISAQDREALQKGAQARKSEQDLSVMTRRLQLESSPVAATAKPHLSSAIAPATIQQNLESIQVGQNKTKLPGLAPNAKELNELAGANTPSKRAAFKPLQTAYHQKAKLERRQANQEARLEGQKKVVDESKKELQSATEAKLKAQTAVDTAKEKELSAKSPDERGLARQELLKARTEFQKANQAEKRSARKLEIAERKQGQIEKHLEATKAQIPGAEKKVQEASQNLHNWVSERAVSHNGEIRSLDKEIKTAKESLAKLKRGAHPDAEKIKTAEGKLQDLQTKRSEVAKQIQTAADNFKPLTSVERNLYNVNVGGKTVQLHDNVIAYAATTPKGMEGSAAGDSKAVVASVVDRSNLSADKKEILKRVSRHEGSFTTINTWDRAVVTAGFIQWTTGEKGNGSLVSMLRDLKSREPELFKNNYQKYGLDVEGNEIKVTKGDGTVLKGAAAAKEIQTDPKLAAVLSAAGTDPKIQDHQVAYAARTKIDAVRNRQVTVDGQTVKLANVISSQYAVGMMMDRAVHGGEGTVDKAVRRGLQNFLAANKGANLSDAATLAKAEKYVAEQLRELDSKRAQTFDSLSKEAGSFQA